MKAIIAKSVSLNVFMDACMNVCVNLPLDGLCRGLSTDARVQIYASKLKLHPVLVIGVLYVAEHLVGVQGLIIAVPCAVFVINNIIMGNQGTQEGSAKGDVNANTAIDSIGKGNTAIDGAREARVSVG